VADHVLTLRASRYTPAGPGNIPTGELASVEGTPLDLRAGAVLGDRLGNPFLAAAPGYDHNFVLDGGDGPAATLYCPSTGIGMEMATTLEGVQLYTAGHLTRRAGKDGAVYAPAYGVCLETQHFPDAVNHPSFPSPVLRGGEEYREKTSFRFFTR
jgi:aldose 1-epimerase